MGAEEEGLGGTCMMIKDYEGSHVHIHTICIPTFNTLSIAELNCQQNDTIQPANID